MNIFRKKFIPIQTNENKFKNKNRKNNNSLIKLTNSQIIYQNNNNSEIYENINMDNTIPTKSIKNTTIDDALYLEQNNYDNESSKNNKDNQNINYESSSKNASIRNKKNLIDHNDLMKYKILYDNETKKSRNNSNENLSNKKYSKLSYSYSYLNKSSSNQSRNKNPNTIDFRNMEQKTNSKMSKSINNFNEENNLKNKKRLIYNYQMSKLINEKEKQNNRSIIGKFKSQSYSKYRELMKKGRNKNLNNLNINIKNNDETSSANDFTKLKYKYLELKNMHDLTLSKLKKEENKNKRQKEDIELIINNIKSNSKNEGDIDEMNEIIHKLKEENETFRQELVLSQALINSLKSELKHNSKFNLIKNNNFNKNDDISINDKTDNFELNKIHTNDINELINKINELNNALTKKNKILDSVLIENKKLRHKLKYYSNDISKKSKKNSENKNSDLIYQEAINLIDKYSQYRKSSIDDFNNLILNENFFIELEKMKEEIEKIKQNNNNKERLIENYISIIKLVSNEFDKLLLYNNNYWKEKYLNKNKTLDNKDIIDKNLEINFNKVKHNLMDLCILSSSYLNGSTKNLLLEGINLIRSLENLYKEKDRIKVINNIITDKNLDDLIIREENQLDNIKKKLENNRYDNSNTNYHNHYLGNSNSVSNFKNFSGLTYMTNYYNNIN